MGLKEYLIKKVTGQKSDGASDMYDKAKTVADGKADTINRIESGISLSGDLALKAGDRIKGPVGSVLKAYGGGVKLGETMDKKGGELLTKAGLGNEGIGGDTKLGSQAARGVFERKNAEVLKESRSEKSYAPSNGKVTWGGKEVTREELAELQAKRKQAEEDKAGEAGASGEQSSGEQSSGEQSSGEQSSGEPASAEAGGDQASEATQEEPKPEEAAAA